MCLAAGSAPVNIGNKLSPDSNVLNLPLIGSIMSENEFYLWILAISQTFSTQLSKLFITWLA
jgi:hypothetical protein